jgi:hypothetical protein
MAALDRCLSGSPGMILSFVTRVESSRLGRISLWQSKDDANQVALRDDILALRSRLRRLALSTEETLMEVSSGHLPQGLAEQMTGASECTPVAKPFGAVA